MEFSIGHAVSALAAYFAVFTPISTTPTFLALTASMSEDEKRRIARRALTIAFVIIVMFALAGNLIFHLFGITLPAFRIAGGLLIFLYGLQMVHGELSAIQHPCAADTKKSHHADLDIAVSPLAMPILAGPGSITMAINFSSAGGVSEFVVSTAALLFLCIVSYVCFVSGARLVHFVGDNGIKVTTRLMGLILAVMGVQMVIEGIGGAFPGIATN